MRFLASITYDGSKYHGFQKLKNQKTVQGELEKALTKLNKNLVVVKGAGRTDRGVHAFSQIVHFDLSIEIDEESLKLGINSLLDAGIHINYCSLVDEHFHARFDALEKTYEYVINLGEYDPLANDYLYNYNRKLKIKAMKKAAKYLVGYHSYQAFVTGTRDNYDSVIHRVKIRKYRDILIIRFVGTSFYTHMVRNIVGALVMVGQDKMKPEGVKEMLIMGENVYNYATVTAAGLYLINIKY